MPGRGAPAVASVASVAPPAALREVSVDAGNADARNLVRKSFSPILELQSGNQWVPLPEPVAPFERECLRAIRACAYNRLLWEPGHVMLVLAPDADGVSVSGPSDEVYYGSSPVPGWLTGCVVDALRGKHFPGKAGTGSCLLVSSLFAQVAVDELGLRTAACLGPRTSVETIVARFTQVVGAEEVQVRDLTVDFTGTRDLSTETCVRNVFASVTPLRFGADRPAFDERAVRLELHTTARRPPPPPPRSDAPVDFVGLAEDCVRRTPDEPMCHLMLGDELEERGKPTDHQRAREAWKRFIELAPKDPRSTALRKKLAALGK